LIKAFLVLFSATGTHNPICLSDSTLKSNGWVLTIISTFPPPPAFSPEFCTYLLHPYCCPYK
jgi:hypothetical protein